MFAEAKLFAGLGLLAALWFGYEWQMHKAKESGRAECQALYAQAAAEGRDENRRIEIKAQARAGSIYDGYRKKAQASDARAAASDTQLDELRNALATPSAATPSDPSASSGTDDTRDTLVRGFLVEAARLAEEGNRGFARAAAKADALQEYIREVCVRP